MIIKRSNNFITVMHSLVTDEYGEKTTGLTAVPNM